MESESGSALIAARDNSLALTRAQSSSDMQNIALLLTAPVEGALIDHLFPFSAVQIAASPVLFGTCIALGVVMIALGYRMYANQQLLRRACLLAPTELHVQLEVKERDLELSTQKALQLETVLALQERWRFLAEEHHRRYQDAGSFRWQTGPARQPVRPPLIDQLVGELAAARAALFGYTIDEVYFIDVFRLSDTDDRLHSVARRCSDHVAQHHRSWSIGEGVIGDCVQKGRVVYAGRRQMEIAPRGATFRVTDDQVFGCIMAAPILPACAGSRRAWGALCISSSEPDRLVKDHAQILAVLARSCGYVVESWDHSLDGHHAPELKPHSW